MTALAVPVNPANLKAAVEAEGPLVSHGSPGPRETLKDKLGEGG